MRFLTRLLQKIEHVNIVARQLAMDKFHGQRARRDGWGLLLRDQLGLKSYDISLFLSKFNKNFTIFGNNVSDFSLLYDLLIKEEYQQVKSLPVPVTILDLGSNIGVSLIYFRLLFPEAKIYGYEPSLSTFAYLQRNVQQFNGIEVFNQAVADKDGEATFYEFPHRSVSSSLFPRSRSARPVTVSQSSFDSIIKGLNLQDIDLVKFDVEGAEYRIFKNARHKNRVRHYIGELHPDLMGCDVETFCQLFTDYSIQLKTFSPTRFGFFASRHERDASPARVS